MSVLSAIQQACGSGIALEKPSSVYGSAVREYVELADIANEMADMIAMSHEWQSLLKLATITGDGATEDFALPSDFKRMLNETQLWSEVIDGPLLQVRDRDDWLNAITKDYEFLTNAWILYGDELHFRPALDTSEVVRYWYQANTIVRAADTSLKTAFDDDDDTFRLDERLLKLGIIWKWREMKGLPYAEDMATYERLLSKLIAADRGPAVLRDGASPLTGIGKLAYPWNIPL